jgi:quercetin dioxygenase-like cupin family protein
MIRFRWYQSGDLFGMRYDMEHGDALPAHAHDYANEHNVIVLHGNVCLEMPDHQRYASAGEVIDFDGTREHTIRCISNGATILNMWLRGIPQGYAQLPESEHSGIL